MKTFVGTSILLFLTSWNAHKISNCAKVKTGIFWSGNSQRGYTKIIRTENLQREENEKYGIITEDTVKWLSDCRFRLITGRVIKNESKIDLSTDLKLEIEILEVKDTYYRQRTISRVTSQSMVSDISRIEPEK